MSERDLHDPPAGASAKDRARAAAPARRGKLTVFFGCAPGVGKTYAMLEAARGERDSKRDVVIGVVDAHGHYDTGALVIGLEMLSRRGGELDLDGVVARRPALVLVDELAHRNAPGARHARRWQDVDELLGAGIDVYTTMNVQHVESLNDVVAAVTGVVVEETVPDHVLDRADEVRVIDLPIDELLERHRAGQVRAPAEAGLAAEPLRQKGNLIALRELALRRTAERVDAQMRLYKEAHGIARAWPVAERILVCVSPSPASARLVRAARRMAAGLRAEWIAVYVETPAARQLPSRDRDRVAQHLRLAEELGAEVATLTGRSAAEETVRYARARNATKIVVGKPTHSRLRDALRPSFLDEVVRGSDDLDVYVTAGDTREPTAGLRAREEPRPLDTRGVLLAPVAILGATAVSWGLFGRAQLPGVVMVYLLAIVLVATRGSFAASLGAAVLAVVTLDFVFVPPYLSLRVVDAAHAVTFVVLFGVAVVISTLTRRVRQQADAARQREARTSRLYAMTRELASLEDTASLAAAAARHLEPLFDAAVTVLVPGPDGVLRSAVARRESDDHVEPIERDVSAWALANGKAAGQTTDTFPAARALHLPLRGSRADAGVLVVAPRAKRSLEGPEARQLLVTFAAQIGSAIERALLAEEAQGARFQMETERMRSSLLSSVSHDLRTPLGVITGAASALLGEATLTPDAARDLVETIDEEATRLTHLVRNLLDMTRLASGAVRPRKEWHPIDEAVGVALRKVEAGLSGRAVNVSLPPDLPPVPMDAVLVEQVLINLLENAVKHTPAGSPVDVSARVEEDRMVVEVADRGPGVPEASREEVFEKFYRLRQDGGGAGAGLGLAICRGVVDAHGGSIAALARDGGGALFRFALPLAVPAVGGPS